MLTTCELEFPKISRTIQFSLKHFNKCRVFRHTLLHQGGLLIVHAGYSLYEGSPRLGKDVSVVAKRLGYMNEHFITRFTPFNHQRVLTNVTN